ncbi:MAG: hypothetical protein AB2A00_20705 [Myxococcota bacterium]
MLRALAVLVMALMSVPALAGPAWQCLCEGAPVAWEPCCCDHDEPADPTISDGCCCEIQQGAPDTSQSPATFERTTVSPVWYPATEPRVIVTAAPVQDGRPVILRDTGPPPPTQFLSTVKLRP